MTWLLFPLKNPDSSHITGLQIPTATVKKLPYT